MTATDNSKPNTHKAMREAMQTRLIAATVDTLVTQGHAQTSVQAICTQAGVSKGALFRHYDRRTDLLAAAAEHMFQTLITRFGQRFATLAPGEDLAARALDLLATHLSDTHMLAARELQSAARTDEVLRTSLAPVQANYLAAVHLMAGLLFPNAKAMNGQFDAVVGVIVGALSNEAMEAAVLARTHESVAGQADRMAFLIRLADAEILIHEPALTQAHPPAGASSGATPR